MSSSPIVLFGAFDRHNLGDFLLGRAAALQAAPRPCLFAGVRAANFSALGGFRVERLGDVLAGWQGRYGTAPLDLVHVGGEILDTDLWEAAVMLLPPDQAPAAIARLDSDLRGRAAWAADFLATRRPAPYVVGRELPSPIGRLEFRAVGGVGLGRRARDFTRAVAAAVNSADLVTVRDERTRQALVGLGAAASLAPDPAAALGPWLTGEIAAVPRLPGDYVACQCAAAFGDDDSLAALAAAPWHDDLAVYERLARRLRVPARIMASLHVRDIVAAIARSRLCLASSLHALLVAGACHVPATGLERRTGEGEKLRAYADTWGGFRVLTPEGVSSQASL